MQTILSLGNALNQGTARGEWKHYFLYTISRKRPFSVNRNVYSGSAVGFRLDSLPKLAETRARNNKLTLIHYLCKVVSSFSEAFTLPFICLMFFTVTHRQQHDKSRSRIICAVFVTNTYSANQILL